MKTIYYLDDDWFYAKLIISSLDSKASEINQTWDIRRIPTESDFLKTLEDIQKGDAPKPDTFILDTMVRYATPSPDYEFSGQQAPSYDRAGLRCITALRALFPDLPIILFTILDREDLPPEALTSINYVAKESNADNLFNALRSVFS